MISAGVVFEGVEIRAPRSVESQRVRYLFRHDPLPRSASYLVAVRAAPPVDRFIAAVAIWDSCEGVSRFRLTSQPGVAPGDFAEELIAATVREARRRDTTLLRCHNLFTERSRWFPILKEEGFRVEQTVRSFEASIEECCRRTRAAIARSGGRIPVRWQVRSLRNCDLKDLAPLVSYFRLMDSAEYQNRCLTGVPGAFDPDLSLVLFEDDRIIGCMLAVVHGDAISIPVRAVRAPNRHLRASGNLMLFREMELLVRNGPFQRFVFHGGEKEHRETANLAVRMGGTEMEPKHSMAYLIPFWPDLKDLFPVRSVEENPRTLAAAFWPDI